MNPLTFIQSQICSFIIIHVIMNFSLLIPNLNLKDNQIYSRSLKINDNLFLEKYQLRTSAKWQSRQLQALVLPQKHWKISRNDQSQLCHNSEKGQRYTRAKWMLSQEKGNLITVGKFCGVFICPCSTTFPVQ